MDPFEALVRSSLGLGVVAVVALWSAVWKLFALYRAGSLRQTLPAFLMRKRACGERSCSFLHNPFQGQQPCEPRMFEWEKRYLHVECLVSGARSLVGRSLARALTRGGADSGFRCRPGKGHPAVDNFDYAVTGGGHVTRSIVASHPGVNLGREPPCAPSTMRIARFDARSVGPA